MIGMKSEMVLWTHPTAGGSNGSSCRTTSFGGRIISLASLTLVDASAVLNVLAVVGTLTP